MQDASTEAVRRAMPDYAEEQGYDPLEFIEGEEDDPELAGLVTDDSLLLPQPLGDAPVRHGRPTVFTPEGAGSAEAAIVDLATTNAGRRPILLGILEWARDGIGTEELFSRIEEAEAFNKSVYDPASYCRMLQRAGGLSMEQPEPFEEGAVQGAAGADGDVVFLTLGSTADPVWRTTPDGLSALGKLTDGNSWRRRVLEEDARYREVYRAVMEAMAAPGAPREQLCALAETFEVTQSPRKMGSYFIDVLESTDAAVWADGLWALTPLGETLLPELRENCPKVTEAVDGGEAGTKEA